MDPIRTFPELLGEVAKSSNPKLLNYHHEGKWHHISTEEFLRQVRALALALHELGVRRGDRVGIVSQSTPFWTIADCAIICSGCITVPLFSNISEENFEFEIVQSGLKVVFAGGEEPWQMIDKHRHYFGTLINMDPHDSREGVLDWQVMLERGRIFGRTHPGFYEEMIAQATPDDVVSIVYTSGSTGLPKGAMLTHTSLLTLVHREGFYWNGATDRHLCVLPLAHIFERFLNYVFLAWAISIYYFNDLKNFGAACKEVEPTILVVVPRLLERIYQKMVGTVERASGVTSAIGKWAFSFAAKDDDSLMKKLLHPVADKLVYSALRDALGGKLRVVITGGAAMNPDLQRFYHGIGVPIYEGWGMTEGCPGTVNRPGRNKVGTVGPPLPGMDVKLTYEGEMLMRGPIVMIGYWNDPEATKQVFTEDGWLKTGDRGFIDDEGYVKIIGRLKEMYKASTGEYVVPGPIEQSLMSAPLIDWAVVIADKRKYAACLLFPNFDVLARLKKEMDCQSMGDAEFLASEAIEQQMNDLVERVNRHLNHWEQLRAWRFVPKTLSAETGEITPSLKIRRDVINEKFAEEIESMYPGEVKA